MTDQVAEKPLAGRIAVVTGASRGIGYFCALGLAQAGAHVIAVARTVGGLEELDDEIQEAGGTATLVPLDINDFDALDRLGASIHERWGKLDILVGNAAILGMVTPLAQISPKQFDDVFATNVTANFRLLRSLDPLLQQSDAGRAVFLTSGAAHSSRPYLSLYSASKSALETLVKCYAAENRLTSVNANLLDPGVMRTKMRARYAPGENASELPSPEEIIPCMIDLVSAHQDKNGQTFDFAQKNWRAE